MQVHQKALPWLLHGIMIHDNPLRATHIQTLVIHETVVTYTPDADSDTGGSEGGGGDEDESEDKGELEGAEDELGEETLWGLTRSNPAPQSHAAPLIVDLLRVASNIRRLTIGRIDLLCLRASTAARVLEPMAALARLSPNHALGEVHRRIDSRAVIWQCALVSIRIMRLYSLT